jgi:hypothetical protein
MKLQFKFTASTVYSPNRQLKIVVRPTELDKAPIPLIESQPFCVVEKYLHVVTDMPEPYVFFKDIGGKDTGIPMTVTLRLSSTSCEENDPIIKDRSLSIRPLLKYASGQSVIDQQILKSINDPRNFVISKDGSTSLCFRISEVSSKHRNEKFTIWMEQYLNSNSTDPVVDDVAPGHSVPLDIRSKLNHNSVKKREAESAALAAGVPPGSIVGHGKAYSQSGDSAIWKRPRLGPGTSDSGHGYAVGHMDVNSASSETALAITSQWIEDIQAAEVAIMAYQSEIEKLTMSIKFLPFSGVTEEWFAYIKNCAESVSIKYEQCSEGFKKLESMRLAMKMNLLNSSGASSSSWVQLPPSAATGAIPAPPSSYPSNANLQFTRPSLVGHGASGDVMSGAGPSKQFHSFPTSTSPSLQPFPSVPSSSFVAPNATAHTASSAVSSPGVLAPSSIPSLMHFSKTKSIPSVPNAVSTASHATQMYAPIHGNPMHLSAVSADSSNKSNGNNNNLSQISSMHQHLLNVQQLNQSHQPTHFLPRRTGLQPKPIMAFNPLNSQPVNLALASSSNPSLAPDRVANLILLAEVTEDKEK